MHPLWPGPGHAASHALRNTAPDGHCTAGRAARGVDKASQGSYIPISASAQGPRCSASSAS